MAANGDINRTQELILELIEGASYNNFNGPTVVDDLRANRHLWDAVLMTRADPLLTLIDLPDGDWNVDTLYILTDEARADELEGLIDERWDADEMRRVSPEQTPRESGEGLASASAPCVVTVWWD